MNDDVVAANGRRSGYWFHMRDEHRTWVYTTPDIERMHGDAHPDCAWVFDPATLGGE